MNSYVPILVSCYLADIDECSRCTDLCAKNSTCSNTDGSYVCTCNLGFVEMEEYTVPVISWHNIMHRVYLYLSLSVCSLACVDFSVLLPCRY